MSAMQFTMERSPLSNELKLWVAVFFLRRQYGAVVLIDSSKRNLPSLQHRLKPLSLYRPDPEFCHRGAGRCDERNVLGFRDRMSAPDSIPRGSRVVVEIPSHSESPVCDQRILAREGVA